MTTATTTFLTVFLLDRIAEDEAAVAGISSGADPDFFWGPDRIRLECAAKRAIVAEAIEFIPTEGSMAEMALCHLAAVYADHADYDPSWAV